MRERRFPTSLREFDDRSTVLADLMAERTDLGSGNTGNHQAGRGQAPDQPHDHRAGGD